MSMKIRPYLDKSGKQSGWEVDITLRFLDGLPPRRVRLKSPEATKTATLRWIQGEHARLFAQGRPPKRGEKRPPSKEAPALAPFLKDFAKDWLEKYVRGNGQAPMTYEKREMVLRLYLLPLFGNKRLDELGAEAFAELKAWLQKPGIHTKGKPLGPNSVNEVVGLLWLMLKTAALWGRLPALPVVQLKGLKVPRTKIRVYDPDSQERLITAAAKRGTRDVVIILLGLHAGLRASEMTGLSWEDIDLGAEQPYLWVNRQEQEPGKPRPPKNKEARQIELSKRLAAALLAHRHLGDRVLRTDEGERVSQSLLHSWMWSIQRRAGLPATRGMHVLRHTFASTILDRGANPKAVQALLGHASLEQTMEYLHQLQQGDRGKAIGLLDQKSGEQTEAEK